MSILAFFCRHVDASILLFYLGARAHQLESMTRWRELGNVITVAIVVSGRRELLTRPHSKILHGFRKLKLKPLQNTFLRYLEHTSTHTRLFDPPKYRHSSGQPVIAASTTAVEETHTSKRQELCCLLYFYRCAQKTC